MIAVLTGDIVHSRNKDPETWMPILKEVLEACSDDRWEIYRGDSFQLVLPPENAVYSALYIKAGIKQVKDLDVRIGIGLGKEDFRGTKVSESNGPAYIRSGEIFENLKKQKLGFRSGNEAFDETMNLMFSLAAFTTDHWRPVVAETIMKALDHPEKNQTALGKTLGKSQSSLSEALKRGGYEEIMRMEEFYRKNIQSL